MTSVRPAAVAGRFYPDDPAELRESIRRNLAAATVESSSARPKAIIVPHAGYVYSGPIAGSGYARLKTLGETIDRVVLLGPAHFVPVEGLAASSADTFETPLGAIPVDTPAISNLLQLPQVQILDEAHAREHSLEVHLPFLIEVLGEFRLIPLAVGSATAQQVSEVLEQVWGGLETLIVISSDLSHYLTYEAARRSDRETSLAIEQGRITDLRGDRACGFAGISGLLQSASKRGLRARTIDLRNSGDTAGGQDKVVGYGAYVIEPETVENAVSILDAGQTPLELTQADEQILLQVSTAAIQQGIEYGRKPSLNASEFSPALQQPLATFVTLTIDGQLRGCMGSLVAKAPLVCDVAANAYSAAFLDPRFSPLTLREADALEIHISVLSPSEPLTFQCEADVIGQLRPGVDGVTIYEGKRRGTLLPAVWEKIADPTTFLQTVKQKAGLPADYWSDTLRVARYTTVSIGQSQ